MSCLGAVYRLTGYAHHGPQPKETTAVAGFVPMNKLRCSCSREGLGLCPGYASKQRVRAERLGEAAEELKG